MKYIQKSEDSPIVEKELEYPKDHTQIREILSKEQSYFCAYTEDFFSVGYAVDIEHFDPTRKNIPKDYFNWYAVGHRWNNKKASKWHDYQPILHLSDPKFEERIVYNTQTNTYTTKANDIEAENLIKLLNINDYDLAKERENYILSLKVLLGLWNNSLPDFIAFLRKGNHLKFRRAVETTFDIKL